MNIFNSLGSNYDWGVTVKALSLPNRKSFTDELTFLLEKTYQGKVLLTTKGREAIEIALSAFPKDYAVGITGYTCYAVYEAVVKSQHRPVFIDLDKNSLNFSVTELKTCIKNNPDLKIVILQNTLGFPCELLEIKKFCVEKDLILIEDLAHCVGTRYDNNQQAGTVGQFTVLSFSQDKMIDGITGGALINRGKYKINIEKKFSTQPAKNNLLNRIYPLLTYIIRSTYAFYFGKFLHAIARRLCLLSQPMTFASIEYLILPPWHAALILNQFHSLDCNLQHRKIIAEIYLAELPAEITHLVKRKDLQASSCLRFPILVPNRQKLLDYLRTKGMYVSDTWYDAPIAPGKYLPKTTYQKGACPMAEKVSRLMVNLPTHQNISKNQARQLCKEIKTWLNLS